MAIHAKPACTNPAQRTLLHVQKVRITGSSADGAPCIHQQLLEPPHSEARNGRAF